MGLGRKTKEHIAGRDTIENVTRQRKSGSEEITKENVARTSLASSPRNVRIYLNVEYFLNILIYLVEREILTNNI